jgi:hypothetical protein
MTIDVAPTSADFMPRAGDPRVKIESRAADDGGFTSVRLVLHGGRSDNLFGAPDGARPLAKSRIVPPWQRQYRQRNRDLGQVFKTREAFTLDAIYVQIGPGQDGDAHFGVGAKGAEVAVQLFEVHGTPRRNDNGTSGPLPTSFDRDGDPRLDDFVEGETYEPLWVARAHLPDRVLAPLEHVRFAFDGGPELELGADRTYAFLVMFVEPRENQFLSLANQFFGNRGQDPQLVHAIRREGEVDDTPPARPGDSMPSEFAADVA